MINLAKIFFGSILILFLYSCGYTPIFTKKDINFSIDKIEFFGDKDLKNNIGKLLYSYRNLGDEKEKISIILQNSKNTVVASKNSKGEPQVYKIFVNSIVKIAIDSEDDFTQKNIAKSVTYSAVDSKSEQKRIEEKLVEDLSDQIAREIVLTIMEKTN
tara:strand:+ start:45 stop:518 length:474 start_codon:yes stop_codon:yes gene_type:complete